MVKKIKRMNIQEFRNLGFLQEVNRLFFHPLGLALEVVVKCKETPSVADSNEMLIGAIWDYRDDPEGVLFGEKIIDKNKIEQVEKLRKSKIKTRTKYHFCDEDGIQKR